MIPHNNTYRHRISLFNYVWKIKKSRYSSNIKIGDNNKCPGDKYCQLCIEDKLAMASHNNPNDLPDERSEILIFVGIKKLGYLVGKINAFSCFLC